MFKRILMLLFVVSASTAIAESMFDWECVNGDVYTSSATPTPWFMIVNGVARAIPPSVKEGIMIPNPKVYPFPDISNLPYGAGLPLQSAIVGVAGGSSARYLLLNGVLHGISSGEIMKTYQLDPAKAQLLSPSIFQTFPPGPALRPRKNC